jgi:hypothetical protein
MAEKYFMPPTNKQMHGWKKKPCPFDPEKLHRWEKMTGRYPDGREVTWTACKNCMNLP